MECCDADDARQEVDDTATRMHKLVIRTLPKGCNPMPVSSTDRPPSRSGPMAPPTHEDDNPFDDITDEKLRRLSGKQDLNRVTYLQLTVDTHKQSVEALGELLPSLTQLRLHQSVLHSFRDLGTSLHGLQILWLMSSGVKDLDGIGALTGLRELYLQFNDIVDVSPLSLHDELHILDLQGNRVQDIVQIEQLGMCVQLTVLNLADNPVAAIPNYRPIVCSYIPQLQTLDTAPVAPCDSVEVTPAMIEHALSYYYTSHPPVGFQRCDKATDDTVTPLCDSTSPSVMSSFEQLLDTAAKGTKDHHSSALTHGTDVVFAGNVTSALRRRSHEHSFHVDGDDSTLRPVTPASAFPPRPSTPVRRESITDTLDRASELDLSSCRRLSSKSRDSILHELKAWKMENTVATMTSNHHHSGNGIASKSEAQHTTTLRPSTTSSSHVRTTAVKEAFGDGDKQDPLSKQSRKKHRTTTRGVSGRHQATHPVDILVLDDMPEEESPTQRQWSVDLEYLSPRIGIVAKATPRQFMQSHDADESSSDSDDTSVRPKKPTSGLFNVGDSLNAIEEWTERITRSEKEEGAPLAVAPVQERCRTPKQHHHQNPPHQQQNLSKSSHKPSHSSSKGGRGSVEEASNSTSRGPNVARTGGPAVLMIKREELPVDFSSSSSNHVAETNTYRGLADDDLVLVLQGKDKRYASQLKTKDSFRSFFQGIAARHLETLLRRAYGDNTDKAHRRMQLMEGWMAVA